MDYTIVAMAITHSHEENVIKYPKLLEENFIELTVN